MDLSQYTYWDLNKLYIQIGLEMAKRVWWIFPIIIIILIGYYVWYK